MKNYLILTKSFYLESIRSKTALVWNLAFPVLFVIGFSLIFANGDPNGVSFVLPGVLSINIITASFFGLSMSMVTMRENGIFRRFRVTPLKEISLIAAFSTNAFINMMISIGLQLLVAISIFKMPLKNHLLDFCIVSIISLFAFIPLGLFVGSTARDSKTAPAITNLLFFPLMFLSGSALPLFLLPGWTHEIAKLLPSSYVMELYRGVLTSGLRLTDLFTPMIILFLTGIIGFVFNRLLFRWESSQNISLIKISIALVFLFTVYVLAFFLVPQLSTAVRPA
ncbi:MAG: ABC transporter permease [Acidobacteriota bacterium]